MATALSKGITGEYAQGENYTASGNTNWRLLNAYALDQWANDPATTTVLTYGYRGGLADTSSIVAEGTVVLTNAATNYVERSGAGVVTVNTTGFTVGSVAMAKVITAAGVITSIQDCRRIGTAQLSSPVFTGVPLAPTASLGTTTTQIATCSYVGQNAISPTLLAAKGDLISASAAATPATLPVGANDKVLIADSTQASGLRWGDGGISPTLVNAKGDLLVATADDTVTRLAVGANGFGLVADSTQATGMKWQARDFSIPVMVGDGVSAVGTGLKAMVEVPVDCTITAVRIVSMNGTSGSIVFDLWKDTYANAPPTVADSITGSNKPTVTTAVKSEQLTFSTWTTTTLSIGNLLAVNVDSASGFTFVLLSITCRRN